MSIHSSLRAGGKGKKHRSVLKRYERLKSLKGKNLWDESQSVLGIPKVKMQRIRVKKEKAAVETTQVSAGASGMAAAPSLAAAPPVEGTKGGKK